ncbi:RNA polymerase sigma-70 factor (ECF subfamily) [Chromatocurvus halotolerans]|uniref:RNA polymerase sigma-70 factor (ECF subfamily) n=2 Tax=Chromatocurvus halotolerans TaxID=1132028 RepID=A0A4R2L3R2_9GAMM|nr:RNA polymerase sigma-70 factor (ECF subfamily) [Chromatocurvus halotolerans]
MPSLNTRQRSDLMSELGGLRRFCLSLTGAAADADDLLQSTVERMLEKGMPEDAHTAKWVYRVCKNIWIDELRARQVRQRHATAVQADDEVEQSPSAETKAGGEQHLAAVNDALMRLPPEQRLALMLVAVDGKSYAEAADILQVPVGTIMSRIARARKHLLEDRVLLQQK